MDFSGLHISHVSQVFPTPCIADGKKRVQPLIIRESL